MGDWVVLRPDLLAVRLEGTVRIAVDGQVRLQAARLHPNVRGRRERPARRDGAVFGANLPKSAFSIRSTFQLYNRQDHLAAILTAFEDGVRLGHGHHLVDERRELPSLKRRPHEVLVVVNALCFHS